MRKARIYLNQTPCGILTEDETGYTFLYDAAYLGDNDAEPIAIAFPLQEEPFKSNILFPFFDGLIPEGWLLDVAVRNWKIRRNDRMGMLLTCCRDCIGAVSVEPIEETEER
jgi:serine/threonine-protein kinase HipA